MSPPPRLSGRGRRKGRRVTRVVRRIELWSVLKISLVLNAIMLAIVLGAVVLLWGLANTTGLVDDLEGFLRDAGFEDFRFEGSRMFQQVAFIGAVVALGFTVFIVLTTALVNLISEVTGGIRFSVIEEIIDAPRPLVVPPVVQRPPTPRPAAARPPTPGFGPVGPSPARDSSAGGKPADRDTGGKRSASSESRGGSGPRRTVTRSAGGPSRDGGGPRLDKGADSSGRRNTDDAPKPRADRSPTTVFDAEEHADD